VLTRFNRYIGVSDDSAPTSPSGSVGDPSGIPGGNPRRDFGAGASSVLCPLVSGIAFLRLASKLCRSCTDSDGLFVGEHIPTAAESVDCFCPGEVLIDEDPTERKPNRSFSGWLLPEPQLVKGTAPKPESDCNFFG